MNIDERNPDYRKEIIEFLEKNGYNIEIKESRSREEIIEGILPIVVDPETKKYQMFGNVTCAAAAAASGSLKNREEFYRFMK